MGYKIEDALDLMTLSKIRFSYFNSKVYGSVDMFTLNIVFYVCVVNLSIVITSCVWELVALLFSLFWNVYYVRHYLFSLPLGAPLEGYNYLCLWLFLRIPIIIFTQTKVELLKGHTLNCDRTYNKATELE